LSVAVNVTVELCCPTVGVHVIIPFTGLVPVVVKVAPAGRPVAVKVTTSAALMSEALTGMVRGRPTGPVAVKGAVMVGFVGLIWATRAVSERTAAPAVIRIQSVVPETL
jgi:hypothetical protein